MPPVYSYNQIIVRFIAKVIPLNSSWLQNFAEHDKKITVSTLFTIARIVLTPFIVTAMILHYWGLACMLFLIAAATDIVDGMLARLRNERTLLGACLDAIADKLLLISCFTTLAFVQSPLFTIPLWFVVLVLTKELILILGVVTIWHRQGNVEIKPTLLGKCTMLMQVCFIIWLFACYFFNWIPRKTYDVMLGLLIVLVGAALFQYMIIGRRSMVGNK